jgi:Zn-dependent protease
VRPVHKERYILSINDIAQALTYVLAMMFALTFREMARAWTTHMLGDDSALRMGRLTLNPAAHLDVVGTLVLPMVCALFGLPFIGWAKPIPFDERNFKHPVRDSIITAISGPVANLSLGFVCMLGLALQAKFHIEALEAGAFLAPLLKLIGAMIYVNGILAFLNLIPLPPLDGAQLLRLFLSHDQWERFEAVMAPYGIFIFLFLAFSGGLAWISKVTMIYVQVIERIAALIIH